MPYIEKELRGATALSNPFNQGELNYALTSLCIGYMRTHGKRYATINDCLGALEGAKQEFYRRVAVPYEDEKIKQNGDVYDE